MSTSTLKISTSAPDIRDLYFARIERNKSRKLSVLMAVVSILAIAAAILIPLPF